MVLLAANVGEAQTHGGKKKPTHFRLCLRNEDGHRRMSNPAMKNDASDCQENSTACKRKSCFERYH